MNKDDLRFARTEKLIEEAFLKNVEEKGFDKTSVSDICRDAGISRHAFYTHYEDKYRLLDRFMEELDITLQEGITQEVLDAARSGNFDHSSKRIVRDIAANRDVIRVLLKCRREEITKMMEQLYLDIPTSMYVEDYWDRIREDRLRIVRASISNSITGFVEEAVNQGGVIEAEKLYEWFNDISNYFGNYYLKQLRDI